MGKSFVCSRRKPSRDHFKASETTDHDDSHLGDGNRRPVRRDRLGRAGRTAHDDDPRTRKVA